MTSPRLTWSRSWQRQRRQQRRLGHLKSSRTFLTSHQTRQATKQVRGSVRLLLHIMTGRMQLLKLPCAAPAMHTHNRAA